MKKDFVLYLLTGLSKHFVPNSFLAHISKCSFTYYSLPNGINCFDIHFHLANSSVSSDSFLFLLEKGIENPNNIFQF